MSSITRPLLVAMLFSLCLGASSGTTFPFDQTPYTTAQRLIDVGGRRMNLYCVGRGSPAVILESGFGSAMWTWGYVQSQLGTISKTCTYDRAGYGFSDPGPLPRDAASIAADLHTLLTSAGISPPYILVGHSLGGYHVRYFADRYPDEVAGLVLIDPATTSTWPILDAIPAVAASDKADTNRRNTCEKIATRGDFASPSWGSCVETDARYSAAMNSGRQWTKRRPGYWFDGKLRVCIWAEGRDRTRHNANGLR